MILEYNVRVLAKSALARKLLYGNCLVKTAINSFEICACSVENVYDLR